MKKPVQAALCLGSVVLAATGCSSRGAETTVGSSSAALAQAGDPYFQTGQDTLQRIMAQQPNTNHAKNVILFVADGMGFPTITATRILEGQQRGVDGESNVLTFESFPYLAASKTYSADGQVSDSSPTAVAMVTGVKTNNGVMAVSHNVAEEDCRASLDNGAVTTIFEMAQAAGLATGVVSTARLTHATPGATYSHSPSRDWESDADMPPEAIEMGCKDIASSLIETPNGHGFDVAMGGGRANFLPETAADPEDEGKTGKRTDNRDLTREWQDRNDNAVFVWNQQQFDAIDPATTGPVLGLFEMSHMKYSVDREKDKGGEPSLSEMTSKAIDILQAKAGDEGFILLVEAGRVDHALHEGNAARALNDAIAFDRAIKTATQKVDLDETLIVVTADHGHTLTISGYPERGNPILGLASWKGEPLLGDDGKPYTTLGFANGPGAMKDGVRADLTNVDTTDVDFLQQSLVPLASETHGGEDLGIYAIGPWSHLFQGTVEQNYIFHVMDHASGISQRAAGAAK
ncbi:alkaline phosphatase [Geminicoccus roseus]|uniref:alkaline phosphatase n=1 Tax=Geminicoccus roseus TaxID=404900 RepID=UPI000557AA16|nr:alkaline phosphatase [Geminicoccus roseus]